MPMIYGAAEQFVRGFENSHWGAFLLFLDSRLISVVFLRNLRGVNERGVVRTNNY